MMWKFYEVFTLVFIFVSHFCNMDMLCFKLRIKIFYEVKYFIIIVINIIIDRLVGLVVSMSDY